MQPILPTFYTWHDPFNENIDLTPLKKETGNSLLNIDFVLTVTI